MPARWAGRKGRPWRELCARVLAEETHCVRCGQYVDQGQPPRTPKAPSVDHIIAIDQGGARLSRGNVALAHFGCNARHGAKVRWAKQQGHTPSRITVDIDPHSL